jgi:hypothetical protein
MSAPSPYTLRSFGLGSVCAALIAGGVPYCNRVLRGLYMTQDFSTMGVIIGQFVSAGVWLVIDACTGMTDNRIFSW